jgi:hypothetical protein
MGHFLCYTIENSSVNGFVLAKTNERSPVVAVLLREAFLVRLIRVLLLLPAELNNVTPSREHYHFESQERPFIEGLPEHLRPLVDKFRRFSRVLAKTLTLKQLKEIFLEFILIDILGSIKEIGTSAKALFHGIKDEFQKLKTEGFISYIFQKLKLLKKLPEAIKNGITAFVKKIKSMSKTELVIFIAKILVLIASAYCGYSIPDLDITLFGIGFHRHFLTHSVFPVLGVALVGKLVKRFTIHMRKNCEEGDQDIKNGLQEVDNFMDVTTRGIALGVSLHLSQDLFIDGSQVIRGPWARDIIPDILRKSYRFDDGYLLVNQVLSYKETLE